MAGPDHGLHIGDALNLLRVPRGALKSNRRAPIMEHQDGISAQIEGLEKRVEIVDVVLKMIGIAGRGRRPAMANQVGYNDAAQALYARDDISPQER